MEQTIDSALIDLPACDGIVDRRTYLVDRARGRRIVHLGCVDEGFFTVRSQSGDLLHAALAEVAAELVGVDLSADGVEAMRAVVPGDYVVGDVEQLTTLDLPDECDLVIAGELIEHLPNPGRFLTELGVYLRRTGATAIITTPNAYSWLGMARFLVHGAEPTHPDHLLVYSPVTLAREIGLAGLEIVSMQAHAWSTKGSWKQRIRGGVDTLVLRVRPWSAVGIVVEVRAGRPAASD